MRLCRMILLAACLLAVVASASAQQRDSEVTVDYNNPKKYIVGGVSVEGNNYLNSEQIIQFNGLQKGIEVDVPGDLMS